MRIIGTTMFRPTDIGAASIPTIGASIGATTRDLANEDASGRAYPLETGTYRLIPVTGSQLANEDACLVKISLVSGS